TLALFLGQPSDVVEAAAEIAAELPGRSLVAELLPYVRQIVRTVGTDERAAHGLEEQGAFHALQRLQADLVTGVEPLPFRGMIERGDAVLQQFGKDRVRLCLRIESLEGLRVLIVVDRLTRIEMATHLEQGLRGMLVERADWRRPGS